MYVYLCFYKMINNIYVYVFLKNKDIGFIIFRLGIFIIYKNEKEKIYVILIMGLMFNCLKLRYIYCIIKVMLFFKSFILNYKYMFMKIYINI